MVLSSKLFQSFFTSIFFVDPSNATKIAANLWKRWGVVVKRTAIGGAIVAAAVLKKITIQGPPPFQPSKKSLVNKVIVITGGNTGLGFESAKRLAKAGATIVIASRSLEKGKKAMEKIQRACQEANISNQNLHVVPLDLCSLTSIREFPNRYKEEMGPNTKIDVLLNNAGVCGIPKLELTEDSFEKTFQTNHLGHFALTALIFPMLSKTGARVINVSSDMHWMAFRGLDLENLNGEKSYGPMTSYAASKLENILFTKELQRRVDASSGDYKNFKALSLTPGLTRTDIFRYSCREEDFVSMMDTEYIPKPSRFSFKALQQLVGSYFSNSVERGATTQIWLASGQGDDTLRGGEYLYHCKVIRPASAGMDAKKAEQLWQISENMCSIQFDI